MSITVTPVRFEHHRESLGIGESTPRLSWVVDFGPAGWRQARYEVEVGQRMPQARPRRSSRSTAPTRCWCPGRSTRSRRVSAARCACASPGRTARPRAWSDWSAVETGLLEASDWAAHLVGPDADGAFAAGPHRSSAVRSRLTDAAIRRARVYVTAHGVSSSSSTAPRVGDHVLAPGWTAYERRLRYQTFDVTAPCTPARTCSAHGSATAGGAASSAGGGRRNMYGDRARRCSPSSRSTYADGRGGRRHPTTTGASAPGPIRSADLYDGEDYDARLERPGWSTAGFDDRRLGRRSRSSELDRRTLVAPTGPPVRHVESSRCRRC